MNEEQNLVAALPAFALVFLVYFLPWFVAAIRRAKSEGGVFALNLLLGWIPLCWLCALFWAVTSETHTA